MTTSMATAAVQLHPSLAVYFSDADVSVMEPKLPLAPGAIEITGTPSSDKLFEIYAKFKAYCSTTSLNGGCYFLERHDAATHTTLRQIIPYPKQWMWSLLTQIQVAWNLAFPCAPITWHRPISDKDALKASFDQVPESATEIEAKGNDPFCKEDRIRAQEVAEKEKIRLLCNFKPIAQNDLLIVTKNHTQQFDRPSFVQAYTLAAKVNRVYAAKGYPIGYIMYADSKASGQSVPHAHMHATSASSMWQEYLGMMRVVRKILFDSWAQYIAPSLFKLSDEELQTKIASEKATLADVLK